MLDRTTEPTIVYGDAFVRHLICICNLRLTHLNEEIYLFDDDANGAFRHPKYHPDVSTVLAFRISSLLIISLGDTFGSVLSPQELKLFARACTHLAEALSHRDDLYPKYKQIIDFVEFSSPPTDATTFVKATPGTLKNGL